MLNWYWYFILFTFRRNRAASLGNVPHLYSEKAHRSLSREMSLRKSKGRHGNGAGLLWVFLNPKGLLSKITQVRFNWNKVNPLFPRSRCF
mmetsp:Transcript_552/g.1085  ORF Transcript_552/g.1085 Transcript_552/m.1085 type:complete len:90 (+) Transcript_552:186-455(+)